jgi:hypothetical protein
MKRTTAIHAEIFDLFGSDAIIIWSAMYVPRVRWSRGRTPR